MGQEERSKEGCYAQTPWRCKSNQAWHLNHFFLPDWESRPRWEIGWDCEALCFRCSPHHHWTSPGQGGEIGFWKANMCEGGGGGLAREAVQPQMVHWGNCMVNWLWTLHIYTMDTMLTMSYAMTIEVGNQLQAWRPPSSVKREMVDREVSCLSWFWLGWWYIITSKTYKSKKPSSD